MSPERKCIINGQLIEEYYWGGKWVVYVDNQSVKTTYEQTIEDIKAT